MDVRKAVSDLGSFRLIGHSKMARRERQQQFYSTMKTKLAATTLSIRHKKRLNLQQLVLHIVTIAMLATPQLARSFSFRVRSKTQRQQQKLTPVAVGSSKATTAHSHSSSTKLPASASIPSGADNTDSDATTKTTPTSWKQNLLKFSNIASFLCVIDCTVLPAVTLLLPIFGLVTSAATSELLCAIGHRIALYFVLPVGFLATTTNYLYNHRKAWITSIGWLGMLLIFGANMPHGHGHHHHAHSLVESLLEHLHHGVWHRVTNLLGCGLLILSNRISHQQQDCCSHHHGHHHH